MKTNMEHEVDKAQYKFLMEKLAYKPAYDFWGEIIDPNKELRDQVRILELKVARLEAQAKQKGSGHWLRLTD